MATIATEEKRCAVCGKTSVQGFVADAGREGSADLDLRPPPDRRETIAHWVKECPHCRVLRPDPRGADGRGCGRDRVGGLPGAPREVEPGPRGPTPLRLDPARARGAVVEAAETALWAAWAADDVGDGRGRRRPRRRALDLLAEVRHRGERYILPDAETLVMADVARRAGEFGRAGRTARRARRSRRPALCCDRRVPARPPRGSRYAPVHGGGGVPGPGVREIYT